MLLILRATHTVGATAYQQIREYFRGLLLIDEWPDDVRESALVLSEIAVVVEDPQFEQVLQRFNALLYVGRLTDMPDDVPRAFLQNWDSDWLVVLSSKTDPDCHYIIVPTSDFKYKTLH
jgi:hypothetical protein